MDDHGIDLPGGVAVGADQSIANDWRSAGERPGAVSGWRDVHIGLGRWIAGDERGKHQQGEHEPGQRPIADGHWSAATPGSVAWPHG